jgi:phage terminase Nu1 subunit (DNA packaging protein)
MSIREKIAENIEANLRQITNPIRVKFVTREPFDFEKLSNAQFPAILVRTADEDRSDSTVGGTISSRMSTINYQLVCYVKGDKIDTLRNKIIEAVEEKLDADRLQDSNAIDTQIISIETDEGSVEPIGGVIITARVTYQYTRGTL